MPTHLSLCQDLSQLRVVCEGTESIQLDGARLTIAKVKDIALMGAKATLDPSRQQAVERSVKDLFQTLADRNTVYGVSTGFGGSASHKIPETGVQDALQGLLYGVIRSQASSGYPSSQTCADVMPAAWVRGAILIRLNSLLRGLSSVRWELCEALAKFLNSGYTPIVPTLGSISASGDLSPLAYIAFTLAGHPEMRVAKQSSASYLTAAQALAELSLSPFTYSPKEVLAITNGTSMSASVASIALAKSHTLAVLGQAVTALNVQALIGSNMSFDRFLHESTRPHPGQIQVARNARKFLFDSLLVRTNEKSHLDILLASIKVDAVEWKKVLIVEEEGLFLKQDRYALRTSPQWLGPAVEDLVTAHFTLDIELNCTSDNPIADPETAAMFSGGNFQASSVTSATEKNRSALASIGRLIFAQSSELINPDLSQGLPRDLVPSLQPGADGGFKGVEIGMASYMSELALLANNASHFVQSAEQNNQSVNSLALISSRQTLAAADILTKLLASALLMSLQALDLRVQYIYTVEQLAAALINRLDTVDTVCDLRKTVRTPLLISFSLALLRRDLRLGAERAALLVLGLVTGTDAHNIATALCDGASDEANAVYIGEERLQCPKLSTILRRAFHAFLLRETTAAHDEFKRLALLQTVEAYTERYLAPACVPLYRLVRKQLFGSDGGVPFYVSVGSEGAGKHSMGYWISKMVEAIDDGSVLECLVDSLGDVDGNEGDGE